MSFSGQLSSLMTDLKSKRIVDKKTAIESMLNLYNNPDVIREITNNTLGNVSESITWDLIMKIAQQIILEESMGKVPANKARICNFTQQTFERSNTMLIQTDFSRIVTEILGKETYAYYQQMYIKALRDYIIPVYVCRLRFSSENWQDLLKVCVNLYPSQTTSRDKSNLLKTIQSVVEYGCLESHLILILKKFLPVLEDIFKSVKSDQMLAEAVLKLATRVCRQIAMEGRFALCDFGETILPNIVFLEGRVEKYLLFLILVHAHHPEGVTLTDSGFYARHTEEWKEILENMFSMIVKECRAEILPLPFVDFASAVLRQISKLPSDHQTLILKSEYDDEYSRPLKKPRLSMECGVLVNTINENEIKMAWPMIQILAKLLKKYPDSLETNEFTELVRIVKSLFSKLSDHKIVLDSLCQLALALIPIQEKFTLQDKSLEDKNYGSEILNSLLRCLHSVKNDDLGHYLIQSLIEQGKISNFDVIIRAYVTQAMKWSSNSVRTLLLLCRHATLPERISQVDKTVSSDPLKTQLLKWVLDIPWQSNFSQFPLDDLTEILSTFPLKFWCKDFSNLNSSSKFLSSDGRNLKIRNETSILNDIKPISLSDIDRCHLSLAFQVDLFDDLKKETNSEKFEAKQICPAYRESDLEFLTSELCKLLQEDVKLANIRKIITKNMIVARAASGLKEISMEDKVTFYPLYNALENSLARVFIFLSECDFLKPRLTDLEDILDNLSAFFQTSYHPTVTKVILSSISQESLRNLYSILAIESFSNQEAAMYPCPNINDAVVADCLNESPLVELPKLTILRLKVTRALKNFCRLTIDSKMDEIQEQLLSSLIRNNISEISSNIDIEIATMLLEIVNQEINVSETILEILIEYLQLLFSEFYRNQKIARYILRILPDYFKHAIKIGFNPEKLFSILLEIHENIKRKIHGPEVHLDFLKCLSKLISIDPSFKDFLHRNSPVVELILEYVNNPFLIVRLDTARCIYNIFSSYRISINWKKNFYKKLTTKINVIEQDKTERTDERAAKLASYLYTIAAVISSDNILQNQALLTLLQLSVSEQIPIKIIQKVLKIANCSLKQNLDHLLIHWCCTKSFDTFPWVLVGSSLESFFISQMHIPILKKNKKISEAMEICEKLGLSFEESFKNSFPKIVAWLLFYIFQEEIWAKDMFQDLKNNEGEFQLVSSFEELVKETLDQIIVNLIQGLDDEDHFSQLFGVNVVMPESIPVRLKSSELDKCLKIVEEEVLNKDLIRYLVREQPSVLQKILLGLTFKIFENDKSNKLENKSQHKLKALYQFVYFCTILMRELKNYYFEEMWIFVVRDICYTLLHLIKDNEPSNQTNPSELACKFLDEFLSQILPERSAVVKEMFVLIVRTLIPLASSDESSIALQTLRFLIVDQKEVFSDVIQKLNSFPHSLRFQEIRVIHENLKLKYTLESEIKHFLTVTDEINLPSNASSLQLLKGKLSEKAEELNDMYRNLETLRGFAEDSASSSLHQLIHRLVKLTESSNPIVSQEAVKCLGILGPGDLTTMILHQEKTEIKEATDGIDMLTYKILILLSNYIIEEDIQLRKASAHALYAVLSSPWGQKLMNLKYLSEFENMLDKRETRLCLDRIRPFVVKSKIVKNKIAIDKAKFKKIINPENSLWKDQSNCSYFDWVTELACTIAESFRNFYLESLIPILKNSLQFCEEILSRIVNIMIRLDKSMASDLCDCINRFFRYNSGTIREEGLQKSTNRNQDSLRCMLNIVNFLRIQDDEAVELRFDYLPIAKAAELCSAYFTSVLYVELWCEKFLKGKRDIERTLLIDRIYNKDPIQGKIVKDIMREASIKIGDPDAVYGLGTAHLKDREARLQYFADLQQWDQMVILQDLKLRDGHDSVMGMLSALKNSGYQFLLSRFIRSADKTKVSPEVDNFQYECAWRLADWNILSSQQNTENPDNTLSDFLNVQKDSFAHHHYKCLKSFHKDDSLVLKSALDSARSSVIKDLRNISLESCKAVYPSLSKLQMLREIEELSLAEPHHYQKILSDWKSQDYIRTSEFQYVEPLLWQRTIMCKIKDSFQNDKVLKGALIDFYLEIAEIASHQGYFKEASRALGTLAKEEGLSLEIRNQLHYQEALLAWVNKDEGLARSLLRNLINQTSNNPRLHAESLRVYGNWMAETQSGNRQTILQKFYLESLNTFQTIDEPSSQDLRNLNNTQAALARFADVHYRQLKDYMQSPEFESVRKVAALSLDSNRSEMISKDLGVRLAVVKNKKQTAIDAAVLEETENEKNYYLSLALEYYVKTLQQSEEHNFLIFRVVSLWLDNIYLPNLNAILNKYLPRIASYKFIQMLPQLAAHMNDEDDEFSSKINNILERCALDHPYHALPVLLSLKHLYQDSKFNPKAPKKNKIEARVVGATKLIQKLSKTKINSIIREMNQLALALVQLAYLEVPCGSQKHNIPKNQEILKIKNFQNVIVPTMTLDVRPSQKYDDVIGVCNYMGTFETVGGINAPKKVICIGTDGISRKQLVKGQDDLRQDAVMQQVFSVMNLLLKASKETKQRKLDVRTYKVVPLTQRSGVLEWCENTVPIATILHGVGKNTGIHKKYYPNDYTAMKCQKIMQGVSKRSNDAKLQAFMDCCKHLTPAFHHFFMETYSSAETWFERRLAYTRSVAVTSIVGYILGIGDRHLLNILLDQTTAQVIHIDFGIAFEQGKVLPVPELIPFRLTRDIEVAMGISGVEGVMRRCCEQTIKVLREQKEVIVTLLQVLLYDPLFTWAITPSSVCQNSNSTPFIDSDLEINKIAERALVRVQQKLSGLEEAVPSSIEGQVERLIQQARDPALLSRIYFGWQAYL